MLSENNMRMELTSDIFRMDETARNKNELNLADGVSIKMSEEDQDESMNKVEELIQ